MDGGWWITERYSSFNVVNKPKYDMIIILIKQNTQKHQINTIMHNMTTLLGNFLLRGHFILLRFVSVYSILLAFSLKFLIT